jgi:hypothetical protein
MENSIPTIESRVTACKDLVASVQTALMAKSVKLATEVMQNFPEANTDWIRCTEYDYGLGEDGETVLRPAKYTFRVCNKDGDGRWTRVVTPAEVAEAIPQMWMMVLAGVIKPYGLPADNFWGPCNWDADCIDILMQLYFYGEIVYS